MNIEYINKIADKLKREYIDCIFILPSTFLNLLIGVSPHLCERFQGLFITKDGDKFYVCPKLSFNEVEKVLKENVYSFSDEEDFVGVVKKALSDFSLIGKTIAITGEARAIDWLKITSSVDINIIDGNFILDDVRIIKTDREITYLKQAAKIADEAFEYILDYIKPGIFEKDICERILKYFEMKNVLPSFIPIIASGENSSFPHYNRMDRKIQPRDNITIDLGCVYKGLCSDMTRSIFIGKPTKTQADIYYTVLEAHEKAKESVKPFVKASDIDRKARNVIRKAGYEKFFLTRLGHGIGYSIHEEPMINGNNDIKLKENMAFSVEPGIYIPNEFGIRIEDIVVVKNKGCFVLNKAQKDLIVL